MSWLLECGWCGYRIIVGDRGMRGKDPGAGVEAAELMKEHVVAVHGRTWAEFLAVTTPKKQRSA